MWYYQVLQSCRNMEISLCFNTSFHTRWSILNCNSRLIGQIKYSIQVGRFWLFPFQSFGRIYIYSIPSNNSYPRVLRGQMAHCSNNISSISFCFVFCFWGRLVECTFLDYAPKKTILIDQCKLKLYKHTSWVNFKQR